MDKAVDERKVYHDTYTDEDGVVWKIRLRQAPNARPLEEIVADIVRNHFLDK